MDHLTLDVTIDESMAKAHPERFGRLQIGSRRTEGHLHKINLFYKQANDHPGKKYINGETIFIRLDHFIPQKSWLI